MKNLATALQKGNLKPKDRVLLIVQNQVKLETTGKSILSEAEIHALDTGWQPKDNFEVKEYNAYLKGWRTAGFAELDAQTAYQDTQIIFNQEKLTNFQLHIYPFYRDTKRWLERLKEIKAVSIDEAVAITQKQKQVKLADGEDFDYAVYLLAYESLSKDIQNDLEELYEEVAYETQYLDEEEILADILRGKDKPTVKDKEKIADLIASKPYNRHAKEYQFYHYFASIPIREVVRQWFKDKGLSPEGQLTDKEKTAVASVAKDLKISEEEAREGEFAESLAETMVKYAKDHHTTVEAELKQTALKWLDNGLLEDYEPLFISKGKNGYNGTTKLPHDELFNEWLKAKTKARETLDNLVRNKKLEVRQRTGEETRQEIWYSDGKIDKPEGKVITGESLYNLNSDYEFVKDFKERVDKYDANLGLVYEDNDPEHKGVNLDRELLVCNIDDKGNRSDFFSPFSMATAKVDQFLDLVGWLKETQVDGETVVEFNDEKLNEFVKKTTSRLTEYYGILLSFREIFKRLSKTYKIDLTYKINKWITEVEDFIDYHNEGIKIIENLNKKAISKSKKARLKDDLFINKTEIAPDTVRTAIYIKEFAEILGEDF